jgi:rubrerythrin
MNAKKREYDLDNEDHKDMYEDMLNECFGDINIAGLNYSTSLAMKKVDEIAYRTGFDDWSDGQVEEWLCEECSSTFDNQEEAEDCCK